MEKPLKRHISKQLRLAANQNIKEKNYWLRKLSGCPVNTHFPYDDDGVGRTEFIPKDMGFGLSESIFSRIFQLSSRWDPKLHMVLVAVLIILLRKYTGSDDVIVGVPVYKQPTEGDFINTVLAIRNQLSPAVTFKELLLKVRTCITEGDENQDYPIEVLVEQLDMPVVEEGFPLFDTAILLENIHYPEYLRPIRVNMTFSFLRTDEGLEGAIKYNSARYHRETIERIIRHFTYVLDQALFKVDLKISDLEILSEEERQQLLFDFNDTAGEYRVDKTVHQWVEEQAKQTPHQAAVVFKDEALDYNELNRKANQLACLLRKKGIGPDRIGGIIMDPSLEMIIGILGILKAGGAYLPISPDYPNKRVVSMLNDSRAVLVLTRQEILRNLSYISQQKFERVNIPPFITKPRPRVKDLDGLQMPDRSLIDYEKYQPYIGQAMMKNDITLQFSRGCVYHCAYCFKIWSGQYVVRSAQNMFEEIRFYYNLGVRRFAFVDDLPNINVEVSRKLYQLIIKNRLEVHLHYVNGIRGDILSRDYIDLMVEAGTVVVDLALETTSPRLQKMTGKNLNLEKLHRNIQYILEKYPHVLLETAILHGIPSETPEEARASLDYIKSLKWIHFPYIHILKIYPNTKMVKIARAHGIPDAAIRGSARLAYHELPDTLPFPKEFTRKYQAEFLKDYFLLKERILHVLPPQMRVFTEDELVQAYNGYLPVRIDSFDDLLRYTGISRDEFQGEFLPHDFGSVSGINEKLKSHFQAKSQDPASNALRILLLDLSQYFSHRHWDRELLIYDVVEPPLGLMYLLTHLKREFGSRIDGKIAKSRIDFNSFNDLKNLVFDFKPDVIGMRSLNFYKDFFHKTISFIRYWGIDVPIVVGGPYATSSYQTMLQDENITLAVLGEGEITFGELMGKMLDNNKKLPEEALLKNIPGIAFVENKAKQTHPQENPDCEILLMEHLGEEGQEKSRENLPGVNQSHDLIYITYTSGSTAQPKGVMIEHRHLVNQLTGLQKRFGFDETFHYILLASVTFDVSVMHIFLPLTTGGKLVLLDEETRKDPEGMWQLIGKNKIDVLNIVPSYMKVLMSSIGKLRLHFKYLFVGGEVFGSELYQQLQQILDAGRVINIYGPTETTINAALYECPDSSANRTIPIGKPLMNYSTYILDNDLKLVPIGAAGELCIAGAGAARGYLNNPELTAEKFLPVTYMSYRSYRSSISKRIYRTGDLARWLPDGNIRFLGRKDRQVKIRGIRLEPGEIENHLLAHQAIKEVVVTSGEEKDKSKYLCAYYVLNKPQEQPEMWPSIGEYFIWDDLMYYSMTHDERRNRHFKKAINRLVKDKIVLDVGSGGDAVLARFCVEAGASKVYAVEILEKYYRMAEEVVQKQGMAGKIILIHGDITKIQLPEEIDVCVSNQCGTIGSSEGAIILSNQARKFLKKNGLVIPQSCITKIAAVTLPENLHQNPGVMELPGNYIEKIFKKFGCPFDLRLCIKQFPGSHIISDIAVFEKLDFRGIIGDEDSVNINLTIRGDGRLDGFLLWLNLCTIEDVVIDTLEGEYVWLPVFVPAFYPGIKVRQGDVITAHCRRLLSENHFSPDYSINGSLNKKEKPGETIRFEYDLSRFKPTLGRNSFYQHLFKGGAVHYLGGLSKPPTTAELREFLARELPRHLIPSYFVQLETIPLTPVGKVDRTRLPAPKKKTGELYIAPRDAIEEKLAQLWAQVLDMEMGEIGIDASFFNLGGHSLKATILVARIHKEMNVKIPLVEFFKTPTIKGLSGYITVSKQERYVSIEPAEEKEYYALSSAQKRLYVVQQIEPESTAYNMPAILILKGKFDHRRLEKTFQELINRHESLRTSFKIIKDKPVQRINREVEFAIRYYEAKENEIKDLVKDFEKPFDLSKVPFLRVGLIKVGEAENILMMDMHHIITDAISLNIFVDEVMLFYSGVELQRLQLQYKDFSEWQNSDGERETIKKQEEYWLKQFEGKIPVLDLPTDYERPLMKSIEGKTKDFEIGAEETAAIKTYALKKDVTLFMVLLTGFNVLLSKMAGQEDIVVGTAVAGRRHPALERIIGIFINSLALRNSPSGNKTFREFLLEVKNTTLEAFDNQDYQFEDLVERVAKDRDPGRNPLFDVIFALTDKTNKKPDINIDIPELMLKPYRYEKKTSKLDMTFNAVEFGDRLLFRVTYCQKLFKEKTINRSICYFKNILSEILKDDSQKLSEIEIRSEEEKIQLVKKIENEREKLLVKDGDLSCGSTGNLEADFDF